MSRFSRIFGDFFDDRNNGNNDDPDVYDETNEVNNPNNPIWDGSDVHSNPYGPDVTFPDPNEVTSD